MNRAILLLCVSGLIPMCLAASASADTLVIGRVTYRDVEITQVTSDTISFQFYGHVVSKPLAEVQKVSLSQDAELNKAEDCLAKGDTAEAIEHYEAALKAAEKHWHKALIEYRMAAAKRGATQATTQPAAATTQPATATTQAVAADPAATPDVLWAILEKRPEYPHYKPVTGNQMTGEQRQAAGEENRAAIRRYTAQYTAWRDRLSGLPGRRVVWELTFQGFTKIEADPTRKPTPGRGPTPPSPPDPTRRRPPDLKRRPTPEPTPPAAGNTPGAGKTQDRPAHWRSGYIVKATSKDGVTVLANVMPLLGKDLDKIKENETVRVTGSITAVLLYKESGKTLHLDAAVVQSEAQIAASTRPTPAAKTPDTKPAKKPLDPMRKLPPDLKRPAPNQ